MIILPRSAQDARKRERTIRPAKAPRGPRKNYQDFLDEQIKYLKAQTANLSQLIDAGADRQQVARKLAEISAASEARFAQVAPLAAGAFVAAVGAANKKAIESSIAKALSVEFATIVDGSEIAGVLEMAAADNAALIRSISSEHLAKVARAVRDNYDGVPLPGNVSLKQRLRDLGGITDRRAKFIARDQTNKLTGDLNSVRQEDNGIEEYKWRNSRDQRVVGNPAGLYPKGNRVHGDHWDREGKTYAWSKPPHDGHPGRPPGCRCYAEPILNIDKLKAQYV